MERQSLVERGVFVYGRQSAVGSYMLWHFPTQEVAEIPVREPAEEISCKQGKVLLRGLLSERIVNGVGCHPEESSTAFNAPLRQCLDRRQLAHL